MPKEPAAWLHTLHKEDSVERAVTFSSAQPFGRWGVDFDPSYSVTTAPLYLGEASAPLPLDVACPRCGAKVGNDCTTVNADGRSTAWGAATHAARWKAVGIAKPSPEDRTRDYEDSKRRQAERRAAHKPRDWRKVTEGPEGQDR